MKRHAQGCDFNDPGRRPCNCKGDAFEQWLQREHPLIAAGADRIEAYRTARLGMELAWDAAMGEQSGGRIPPNGKD